MTLFLFSSFYVVMALAALHVEGIFALLDWLPSTRGAAVAQAAISFNYTAILDIDFGLSAVVLLFVFSRNGGRKMMRMMKQGDDSKKPAVDA